MIKIFFQIFLPLAVFFTPITLKAQFSSVDSLDNEYLDWYNLDLEIDGIPGASVDRAYKEILKDRAIKKKVIVAIIDSGVDVQHEDLVGKIWTNDAEIEGNSIDDDGNGYIDDIHGWNFIGNSNGENIHLENYEYTRIYRQYYTKYQGVYSSDDISEEDELEYETFSKSKRLYETNLKKHQKEKEGISMFEEVFEMAKGIVKQETGLLPSSAKELKSIKPKSKRTSRAIDFLIENYEIGLTEDKLLEYRNHNEECLSKHLNIDYQPREIIGDNPADIEDTNYGNNNVKGPRSDHGTSVSGVIAANRNNGQGINGIAQGVELMILRTVPKGDEYDKDVALAIRYAVDNGANIVNMSFGKEMSPNKEFVDEAIKYAESKNVLMVHASGNKGINVDLESRFPNNNCLDGTKVETWINVGASTKYKTASIAADFSNYGKLNVDIFAPGKDIISLESENLYSMSDGTSVASPIVTGVAALVWSYYPDLTALQLKKILLNSSLKIKKSKVLIPDLESEKRSKTKFNQLSVSGGIVNAYQALKLADKKSSN